jgi:hypothetical protein
MEPRCVVHRHHLNRQRSSVLFPPLDTHSPINSIHFLTIITENAIVCKRFRRSVAWHS